MSHAFIEPLYAKLKTPLGSGDKDHQLEVRLKYIISHHPSSEIHRDMFRDVYKTEKLAYAFLDEEGLSAQFEQTKSGLAVLILSRQMLTELDSRDKIYRTLLVIYHEHLHYLQWRKAKTKERNNFQAKEKGEKLSAERCEQIWRNEKEAYFKECLLANQWKKADVISNELCLSVETQAKFEKNLSQMLLQWPNPELIADCKKVWSKD